MRRQAQQIVELGEQEGALGVTEEPHEPQLTGV